MKYDTNFFDYVDEGAIRSAQVLIGDLYQTLKPHSVLDVGCGRGGWLRTWKDLGCEDVVGVDGDYVDREKLYIPQASFQPIDLSNSFDLGRTFDVVQCLEVAEHLPPASGPSLIESLCRHSDVVVFSAAQVGQGGTQHINERPLQYWRDLFKERGYSGYDYLRPKHHSDEKIEPWYRYNTIVYANAAGVERLPSAVRQTKVEPGSALTNFAPFSWRLRYAAIRHLPTSWVDTLARLNAAARKAKH
jgi:SAM-dependent methyltransferase